jgi:hypothetical protein
MIKFIIAVCLYRAPTRATAAGLLGLSKIDRVSVRSGDGGALIHCDQIIHFHAALNWLFVKPVFTAWLSNKSFVSNTQARSACLNIRLAKSLYA